MANDGSDWEFVFDGVFGFLSSPLWSVPMMSFIDAQSVVFEPTEENHLEWTEIHKKYRSLVESLLTSYLQDVGITEEQFMKACTSPSVQRSMEMQQICEQLFAGEDFEIFKKMMIQRNVELELEALKLIQKRQGKKKGAKIPSSRIPTEEEIIREVMKRSEAEYLAAQKKKSADSEGTYDASMEKIISESTESERLEQDVITKQEDTKRVVQESIKREDNDSTPLLEKVPEKTSETPAPSAPSVKTESTASTCKSPEKSSPPEPSPSKSPPPKEPAKSSSAEQPKSPPKSPVKIVSVENNTPLPPVKRESSSSEAASQWIQNAKEENASSSSSSRVQKNAGLSEEDIKKREQYLKEQRNRIQEMKNQERQKQLNTYTKKGPERPTSARVARKVVEGETSEATEMSADEQKKLAMRRVLADKLKRGVVYKDIS